MGITNQQSQTNIEEIADGIYRINTPVEFPGGAGGFSFNQYLIVDDEPLLFHTGPRKLFDLVREAVATVLPVARLRHISFSHFEADECGSLNEWLTLAPQSAPLCSALAAMISIADIADRPPRPLQDGETLSLGKHVLQWFDTPHLPHGWESGLLMDKTTGTLFCGDLLTQPGAQHPALTEGDILETAEGFRKAMDYYAHAPNTAAMLERLAAARPSTLACMHGSAWRGDGEALLRTLASRVSG